MFYSLKKAQFYCYSSHFLCIFTFKSPKPAEIAIFVLSAPNLLKPQISASLPFQLQAWNRDWQQLYSLKSPNHTPSNMHGDSTAFVHSLRICWDSHIFDCLAIKLQLCSHWQCQCCSMLINFGDFTTYKNCASHALELYNEASPVGAPCL